MTETEFENLKIEFDLLIRELLTEVYIATGYEWIVCPKTGANRSMKIQHGLYIQPTDGIDNDRDGLIDEADEFVTKADAGSSAHNYNLARDCYPCKTSNMPWFSAPKPLFDIMRKLAVQKGLVIIGEWDLPHIEHPKWREVRTAWKSGDIVIV